ncbi:MAG: hypothetical protein ACO26U_14635, partial [Burkholderiaceae bacterium]
MFRTDPGAIRLRRALRAIAALLILNAVLSFKDWWPTPGILPDHRIAPEFIWLWVLLLGLVAWKKRLGSGALTLLGAGYMLLVLGRYADVVTPTLFGRPVNVYWDGLQIPRFLWVSAQERPLWQVALALLAVLMLLLAVWRLLRWALRIAVQEAVPYALNHRWTWVATLVAVGLALANHAGVQATWPVVSKPVVPTYWRQARILVTSL